MEISTLGKLHWGRRGGWLQHCVATPSRTDRDNNKGFSFWKFEGISVSESGTGRQPLVWVRGYLLYKQLPWARNGSPRRQWCHRMGICRCPASHLISLLLFLFASETACRPSGKRPCKMQAFRIWDINQKTFYLRNNQLVAGYLQGPNTKLEEKIDVVPVEPHTVFLGIHGGKLCLACAKVGDEIRLQLENVNITDLSRTREEDKRFTFIRSENGPTTSFESAACPGWFLCTELEADQPVSLTNTPKEAIKVTKFYFQQD